LTWLNEEKFEKQHENAWGFWGFGLFRSSGIPQNTTFLKLDLFPPSDEGVGDIYSVGPNMKS
jgi:hypothetical protein